MNAPTLAAAGFGGFVSPSRTLVAGLRTDAAISSATAALQLLFTADLAARTGLPPALVAGTGIFFVGYVVLLVVLAAQRRAWRPLVVLVAGGNALWALGCVGLAMNGDHTALGTGYLLLQAAAVLVFSVWQFAGLRRSVAA